MDKTSFTAFLHEKIPLTAAMQIQTEVFSTDKIILSVPFAPNKNDKNTGFGGSIACLMTVCGWSMMYINFYDLFPQGQIVIQKSEMRYLAPIHGDFQAICICDDEESKQKLITDIQTKGKGKLPLHICCISDGTVAAECTGTYYITI